MIQEPPIPFPDPNIIIPQLIPLFGMLTGIVITGFVALGPVGRAIGDVIRHMFGAHKKGELPAEDIEALHNRLDGISAQLTELAERQEFSDRVLARLGREKALPGGPSDVAG